jgi:CBS domain-containing protein
VLAIVALDDALALLLYRVSATGADAIMGLAGDSAWATTFHLLGDIFGAILLGFIAGVMLNFLLKLVRADDKILGFSISSLLLIVGISILFDVDPILPAMTFGVTIANLAPRQSKSIFSLVKNFSPPIYTSFFVLAGAHMEFGKMMPWMFVMILVYAVCRAIGKVLGSWAGARYCKSPPAVCKYLGICLLPQAGVAIGLAILAGQKFDSDLGKIIIMVVMAATFLMEIIGPILVKVGVKKAGEVGLNITEEDLIKSYAVKDVMETKPTSIGHDRSLQEILTVFSTTDSVYYPVVDKQSRIIGIITIARIKEMFANQDVAGWLLAVDVAEPILDKITPDKPLEDVMEHMDLYDLENIPVVASDDDNTLKGMLDKAKVLRHISAEVLNRRRAADQMALGTI